uniref:Uncharacterized protein n=1 Tax=Glossina pallidipes TaxID=7398 RepID=A0A1A9ZAR4_GLOPL
MATIQNGIYLKIKFEYNCYKKYNKLITDDGTTIKCGPQLPFTQAKCASRAIVCIVLPKPISSANIPLSLRSFIVTSQSRPICWYSRNVCFKRNGTGVTTFVDDNVLPLGCKLSAKAAASLIISSLLLTFGSSNKLLRPPPSSSSGVFSSSPSSSRSSPSTSESWSSLSSSAVDSSSESLHGFTIPPFSIYVLARNQPPTKPFLREDNPNGLLVGPVPIVWYITID